MRKHSYSVVQIPERSANYDLNFTIDAVKKVTKLAMESYLVI